MLSTPLDNNEQKNNLFIENIMIETAAPRILISILNWNALNLTINCINSILESSFDNIDIIVVDNASNENEADKIQQRFPNISIVRNQRNLGFAGGHNQVIRIAIDRGFDYIWLVNNDCSFKPTDLENILGVVEADPKIGIVSPIIALPDRYGEERFQFVGSWFNWETQSCIRPKDPALVLRRENKFPNDMWVTGTAMLLRCEMLKKIGGLDERYFAYFEDNELGARASRAGYLSRMAFDVEILHHSFSSTHDRPPHYFYLCSRNAYLFWVENTPQEFRKGVRLHLLANTLLEAKSLQLAGRTEQARACIFGFIDAILGRYGMIRMHFKSNRFFDKILKYIPYRLLFLIKK